MSITDPILVIFSEKHGWILTRGRETFYDEERKLRSWKTEDEARKWLIENLKNFNAGS